MRSLLLTGLVLFALSFCGLSERLKNMTGGSPAENSNATTSNTASTGSTSATTIDAAKLTPEQQAIASSGTETKWTEQGLSWILPANWKKMDVKKEQFFYTTPDNASLIVTISVMPDNFPVDTSLTGYYDQALQQLKNGKYESVRMLAIDGVKGVEFTEAMPEEKDGPRRHQWIAYRNYIGQNQQLNVMTATKGTNFDKHRDDFTAVMYSMKFVD